MRAAIMIHFVFLMLTFVLLPTTTAFVSCTTRRASYSKLTCYESTTSSKASEIMDLLETRYSDMDSNHGIDWKRTRSYAYKASKRLDMTQVNQVLSFLDERKYNVVSIY